MSEMQAISVRLLLSEDAEQYVDLRLEALRTNPESFLTSYEETIHDENLLETWRNRLHPTAHSFTLGAFQDDSLVSVATLIRENRMKLIHKASLVAVYTTPILRGKGVAKTLLTNLIHQARELDGLEQINLSVANQNTPACKLYQSLGFRTYGTEKNALKYNDTYWDDDHMVLFL